MVLSWPAKICDSLRFDLRICVIVYWVKYEEKSIFNGTRYIAIWKLIKLQEKVHLVVRTLRFKLYVRYALSEKVFFL